MKNFKIILPFLITLTTLTSCERIMFGLLGGHKPRVEKDAYIFNYGLKNDIDSTVMVGIKKDDYYVNRSHPFNQLSIFDNNGYYIDVYTNTENPTCKGNALSAIEAFSKITFFPRDSTKTLANESSRWEYILTKKDFGKIDFPKADYTILYYWNTFLGEYRNQEYVRMIKSSISKNKDVSFDLYLVNEDYRDGFSLD